VDALRRADITSRTETVADFTPEGGAKATLALLDSTARPTGIFYDNDLMAIAGMMAAASWKLRAPRDLAVVGSGDIPMAAHVAPTLTSVTADTRECRPGPT
jgi:DNA-binding LacI/PurR family transcriptional regulator